jgi:hypothetical protein
LIETQKLEELTANLTCKVGDRKWHFKRFQRTVVRHAFWFGASLVGAAGKNYTSRLSAGNLPERPRALLRIRRECDFTMPVGL